MTRTLRVRRDARGALLFEMLIALAVFIATALAIMAAVRQGQQSLMRTIDRARAADLARSAAAEIAAGIATPDELDGPVESEANLDPTTMPAEPTGWEFEIEPGLAGEFGLTLITVTASHIDKPGARHTTRRLTTLEDSAGGPGGFPNAAIGSAPNGTGGTAGDGTGGNQP